MTNEITSKFTKQEIGYTILSAIEPKMITLLENNKGKKIFKVDGTYTAKFGNEYREMIEKVRLELDCYDSHTKDTFRIHHNKLTAGASRFEFWLSVCYSEGNNISCNYTEFSYIVGKVNNENMIDEIYENSENIARNKSYKLSNILRINKKVKKLILAAEELQKDLPYYAKYSLPYVSK